MHYAEPDKIIENMWNACQKDAVSLLSGQLVQFKINRKGYEDWRSHPQRENAIDTSGESVCGYRGLYKGDAGQTVARGLTTVFSISDIVNFAKEIAATLKSDKANQTRLLERAEEILTELNFTTTNATLVKEQELAMSSLSQAKTLLNNTLRLWNDLNQANRTLDELLGMFGAILDKTGGVLENASLAMDANKKSRGYDSEVSVFVTGQIYIQIKFF